MNSFTDKIAVITGGASGIGYALAEQALQHGMRVAIADVEQSALEKASEQLSQLGEVLPVVTNVADADSMEAFAKQVKSRFGRVHLLCNNAGVGGGGPMWELSQADWEWVLGANLWGVIHGIRLFTPMLVEQNEGHILNTASIAGLVSAPGTGPYTVSKHAVVALSECLYGELRNAGKNVGVSVLCPSFVNTNIFRDTRNRQDLQLDAEKAEEIKAIEAMTAGIFANAMPPELVAKQCFDAIAQKSFYILPHREGSLPLIEQRMNDILHNGQPSMQGPEQYPGM